MFQISKRAKRRILLIVGSLATVLILLPAGNKILGFSTGDPSTGCGAPPPVELEVTDKLRSTRQPSDQCRCDGYVVNVKTWCGAGSSKNAQGSGKGDDAPAIQKALDCLNAIEGTKNSDQTGVVGTLYFPPGVYALESTITIPWTSHYQGLRVTGESQQTSVLLMKSDQTILRFGSDDAPQFKSSRFELSHLALISHWEKNAVAAGASPALEINRGQFAHIHDLALFSSNTAVKLNGLEFSTIKRVHIWPPWGAYVFSSLLPATQPTLDVLAESKALMFDLRSDSYPVLDVAFEDCIVNAGGTGYSFYKGDAPFSNVSVRGGFIQNLSEHAIRIQADSGRAKNISLKNIHVENLSDTSNAIFAANVSQLLVEGMDIPNEGIYGLRLEDAMRVAIRNSSNFGIMELSDPESLSLILEHSYFAGLEPADALGKLKERSIIGTTVLGHPESYGIKTEGEVIAERVIVDGLELGRAFGIASARPDQDQRIPSGARLRTTIDFQSEQFDQDDLINEGLIQTSRPGYYRFDVSVTLKDLEAGAWVKLFLYQNKGQIRALSWDSTVAQTPRRTYKASAVVHAKEGDEFSIRLTHNATSELSTDSNYGTYLDVQYIGK